MTGWRLHAAAMAPMFAVVVARLLGPEDLDMNDQSKQALYVLDIWQNGNVVLPMEKGLVLPTKPPLYPWLAAVASLPAGGPSEFACRLPSALAALAVAWILFLIGSERRGAWVGLAAAWMFAAGHTAVKLSIHVRPDMVLTLAVVAALFAFHRIEAGRPRRMALLFWLATSLSVLAKGPPGPMVVGGALALLWFDRGRRPVARELLRSRHTLWLLAPFAWFVLAYLAGGGEFIRYSILGQTFDRALGTGIRSEKDVQVPGTLILIFVARFFPWSVLALVGGWRGLWRWPPAGPAADLRLAAAWFLPALLMFSLPAGQREDYILPLLAGASLAAAASLNAAEDRGLHLLWKALLAVVSIGAAGLGVAVFAGAEGEIFEPGAIWGVVLLAGAGLVAVGALMAPKAGSASQLSPRSFGLALVGVLLLVIGYYILASRTAQGGRGPELREFVSKVETERRSGGGGEIAFYEVNENAVRFYTLENLPSIPEPEMWLFLPRHEGQRRLFVICDDEGAKRLRDRFPRDVRTAAAVGRWRLLVSPP